MPRPPLNQMQVTPHGAYGLVRTEEMANRAGRRLCSGGTYPCTHRGVDLAAAAGTPVYAPEAGYVVYAVDGDDVRPFSRYGPAIVVLKGIQSNRYHLLAHLAAPNPFGDHRDMTVLASAQRLSTPLDPQTQWDQDAGEEKVLPSLLVVEGALVGRVSTANHLHWEVRRTAEDRNSVENPLDWLASKSPATMQGSDGGALLLAIGFFWLLAEGDRR